MDEDPEKEDLAMKFTLSWLKEHLETTATLDEIVYALTDLGLEVEGVEDRAAKLADFTIGYVQSAEQHPDADRLRVCQVETDEGVKQIICGAPNARAGIKVVVAKPGVYVPGIDTTIGVGKIRGIESFGMMASEREMELSEEHDGIIELSSGKVGDRFIDWLAEHDPTKVDPVIEIAITPNRPDALGVRGVARDLAARGLGMLKPLEVTSVRGAFPCPIDVQIDADTLAACPVFFGRVIRGVKNGPSPAWLQDKLRAIGLRPISTLVDITNYFTYDQNRPLHVFDADKVDGGLRVHRAKGDEILVGLDDKTYTFEAGMTLISDAAGVESIGGVMGGLPTGCTEATVNVFLEAAYFETIRTALTGRALKINSDARYRFERGIDPAWTPVGIELATQMILDLCGGEASDLVVAGHVPDTARSYQLNPARVISLVGMEIPREEQIRILTALGFSASGSGETLDVSVPSWRPDVLGEADLVEEVARVASLTKLVGKPLSRPKDGVSRPILTPMQKRERIARRTTATLGYNECVTYSFIDKAAAALFGGGGDDTMLQNPISSEMSHMRPALLPGLLQAAARNQARGSMDLALFEIGTAFHGGEPGQQHLLATGLLIGHASTRDPHGSRRPVDVFDVKADAEAVLAAMGAPAKVQILRGGDGWWHPGRHGLICLGPKKILGIFGEVHPKILAAFGIKGAVMAFTLWPEEIPLPRTKTASRGALEVSDLQSVDRDFAFVVDARVEALTLVNAAAGADKKLISGVSVFDEFSGAAAEAQMGEGKKSIALSVRLQPQDKTLTEEEIEGVTTKIIEKVSKATGGFLRS
ncbi:MAG: phenylalanyl-tRNA synthetase beta chain [Paracoccaceae bacterium]